MKNFSLIVASDEKYWIWKNKDLAWKISADLKYFKKITTETSDLNKKNALIMWRTTWESIPQKFRPLPNRTNCVLTSQNLKVENEVLKFSSFESCISVLSEEKNIENIFVIWWAKVYEYISKSEFLENIYFTKVFWDFWCDVFINSIWELIKNWTFKEEKKSEIFEENWIKFQFFKYKKI